MTAKSHETPMHGATPATTQRVRLPWPPPGLEPIHDTLWPLVTAFTTGALVLALPLLLAIGLDSPYWSLGTFGQSWWIPAVTSLLGFVMLLTASWRLSRVLRGAAAGAALGHGAWVILAVAADRTRDNGFVLQGARSYAALDEVDRRRLVTVRGIAPVLYLCAALWIPFGLTVGALLGNAQLTGTASLWAITIVPAALLWFSGLLAHALAGTLARPARAAAPAATAHGELQQEASEWTANLALLSGDDEPDARRVRPGVLRLASWLVVVPALLLVLVVMAVAGAMVLGPALAGMAVPRSSSAAMRQAELAIVRPYRLTVDPSISAQDAGHALHALMMMAYPAYNDVFRQPVRRYDSQWWEPTREGTPLGNPQLWPVELFERVADGLSAEERAFLDDVAAHPAHAEFEILAGAGAIDVAGTRFVFPLPADMALTGIPIVRFGHARTGAHAHIARAASQLADGDDAAAERTVREVISAGVLIADESIGLIDALIGAGMARAGGDALVALYRATGRATEGDRLAAELAAGARVAGQRTASQPSLSEALRQMQRTVVDDGALRGLRWEYLVMFNTVSPCINLNQAVLGRDRHYRAWLAEAEQELVRYEGDRPLFELARKGAFGTRDRPGFRCGFNLDLIRQIL